MHQQQRQSHRQQSDAHRDNDKLQQHQGMQEQGRNEAGDSPQRGEGRQQQQVQRGGQQRGGSGYSCVSYSGSYSETISGGQRKSSKSELLMDSDGTFRFSEASEDSANKDKPSTHRTLHGHWKKEGEEANFEVDRVEPAEEQDSVDRNFSVPLRQLGGTQPFAFRPSRTSLWSSEVPDFLRLL